MDYKITISTLKSIDSYLDVVGYNTVDIKKRINNSLNEIKKGQTLPIDSVINWLRKNKKFLSIRGIEKHLNMPDSTLIKAVNGSQNLSKEWEKTLSDFIMALKNQI